MNRTALLRNFPFRVILGSASPRRQQLLSELGFTFTVEVSPVDENEWPGHLRAQEIAVFLAEYKSRSFSRELLDDELLVTADTIVWKDDRVFNKPADAAEAKQMLLDLSGEMHEVFTGVCLRGAHKQVSFYSGSKVWFRQLADDEIEYYLEKCKPFDKAGSYGVQEWLGYVGIENIHGSFYNIMGLPVKEVYENLLAF